MTTDKFQCPTCHGWKSRVIDSRPDKIDALRYLRWRHCDSCHQLFETAESATGRTLPLHEDRGVSGRDDRERDQLAPEPLRVVAPLRP